MSDPQVSDTRPALRIASITWERAGPGGGQQLVDWAAELGLRLVIVRADGEELEPPTDLRGW